MKLPADNEHEPELVAIDCEGGGAATLGHFSNQFYIFILDGGSAAQATRPLATLGHFDIVFILCFKWARRLASIIAT